MKTKKCSDCGGTVSKSAKTCPHCGAKNKKGCFARISKLIIIVVFVAGIIGVISLLMEPDSNLSDDPGNSNLSLEQSSNSGSDEQHYQEIVKYDALLGEYLGRDKCSQGRNKDQWSNSYPIEVTWFSDDYNIIGIYFQRDQPILIEIEDYKITIPEQNIGTTSFVIRGSGKYEAGELSLDYEVDVVVDLDTKEYITNVCHSVFNKN